jgi:Leucine-rich repeat (LRR) protein
LNHNQLRSLPAELAGSSRLRILDAGGNPIASLKDIQVGAHPGLLLREGVGRIGKGILAAHRRHACVEQAASDARLLVLPASS